MELKNIKEWTVNERQGALSATRDIEYIKERLEGLRNINSMEIESLAIGLSRHSRKLVEAIMSGDVLETIAQDVLVASVDYDVAIAKRSVLTSALESDETAWDYWYATVVEACMPYNRFYAAYREYANKLQPDGRPIRHDARHPTDHERLEKK